MRKPTFNESVAIGYGFYMFFTLLIDPNWMYANIEDVRLPVPPFVRTDYLYRLLFSRTTLYPCNRASETSLASDRPNCPS